LRLFSASLGIYYSDDLGETWHICGNGIPNNLSFWLIETGDASPGLVLAASQDGRIYRSQDCGESWTGLDGPPGPLAVNDLATDPLDSNVIYSCRQNSGVFRSSDLGDTWEDISGNLPRYDPSNFVFSGVTINPLNATNIFVCAGGYGVYVSYDSGRNWESCNQGLRTYFMFSSMSMVPADTNFLVIATDQQSVWSIHRTITGVEDEESPIPTNITLSAYPNPFNSRTVISVAGIAEASIGIYDITGRRLATLKAENGRAVWDAVGVSSGVYFARLEGSRKAETLKMVLLR
jgi:hypothetical protein